MPIAGGERGEYGVRTFQACHSMLMNSLQPMSHPISRKKQLLLVGCCVAFFLTVARAQFVRAPEAPAFFAAAASGNEEVRRLLRIGFPVDCTNDTGQMALMLAAATGNVRLVAKLLNAAADLEKHDRIGVRASWMRFSKESAKLRSF